MRSLFLLPPPPPRHRSAKTRRLCSLLYNSTPLFLFCFAMQQTDANINLEPPIQRRDALLSAVNMLLLGSLRSQKCAYTAVHSKCFDVDSSKYWRYVVFFQFAGDGGNDAGSNGQTCRSQLGTDLLEWLDSLHSAVLVTHVMLDTNNCCCCCRRRYHGNCRT